MNWKFITKLGSAIFDPVTSYFKISQRSILSCHSHQAAFKRARKVWIQYKQQAFPLTNNWIQQSSEYGVPSVDSTQKGLWEKQTPYSKPGRSSIKLMFLLYYFTFRLWDIGFHVWCWRTIVGLKGTVMKTSWHISVTYAFLTAIRCDCTDSCP